MISFERRRLTQLTERARVPRPQVFRAHPPHPLDFRTDFHRISPQRAGRLTDRISARADTLQVSCSGSLHRECQFLAATLGCESSTAASFLPPAAIRDLCPGSTVGNDGQPSVCTMMAITSISTAVYWYSCTYTVLSVFGGRSAGTAVLLYCTGFPCRIFDSADLSVPV